MFQSSAGADPIFLMRVPKPGRGEREVD